PLLPYTTLFRSHELLPPAERWAREHRPPLRKRRERADRAECRGSIVPRDGLGFADDHDDHVDDHHEPPDHHGDDLDHDHHAPDHHDDDSPDDHVDDLDDDHHTPDDDHDDASDNQLHDGDDHDHPPQDNVDLLDHHVVDGAAAAGRWRRRRGRRPRRR